MEVGDPLIKNNQQLLNRIHVVLDAVVMPGFLDSAPAFLH